MHFSGKLAIRAGVLGVAAAAAIAVPTTAAHAAGPSITVTPNSGLHNAQTVSVSGSGFANDSAPASIIQCSGNPATATPANCDTTNLGSATTGADGTLPATNYTVHTGPIGSAGGTCPATGSGNLCFIAVSTDGGGADSAAAPITFAVLPSITATPSTGVKNGQKVSVSGKNFPAHKQVAIVSCSSATDASKCDTANVDLTSTTDASGSFKNSKLKVATTASGGKCKAGKTCFIVATTDIAGQGADKSQDAVTTIKLASASAKASTKTTAKAKGAKVLGTVKAGHKGVKGLKVVLDKKKGGHWKKVDSSKTKKAGKFAFSKLSSGKYEVKTPKQTKGGKAYGASHSHKVHVKAAASSGAPASPCANCTVA